MDWSSSKGDDWIYHQQNLTKAINIEQIGSGMFPVNQGRHLEPCWLDYKFCFIIFLITIKLIVSALLTTSLQLS